MHIYRTELQIKFALIFLRKFIILDINALKIFTHYNRNKKSVIIMTN